MAVARNTDGRLEIFARGIDDALIHIWQSNPGSAPWSDWERLGQKIYGAPSAGINADGRLQVFFRNRSDEVEHVSQTTPGSAPWSGPSPLGGILHDDPIVARTADNRLEAFGIGQDRAMWHSWQLAPNSKNWSSWESLRGYFTKIDPIVVRNASGNLELFAVGREDLELMHLWQRSADSRSWATSWQNLHYPDNVRVFLRPAVGRNQNGRLEVFVWNFGRNIWRRIRTSTSWSGWQRIDFSGFAPPDLDLAPASSGDIIGDGLFVARNLDGRLELFARAEDRALWHAWQTAPNATSWSRWKSLGGVLKSAPAVASNSDGRLEVFAAGSTRRLNHIWQVKPNGDWSDWEEAGEFAMWEFDEGLFDV